MISIPQLCDHGCEVLLTSTSLHVIKDGKFLLDPTNEGQQVLYGIRNPHDRLWDIPLPQSPSSFQSSISTSTSKLSPSSSSSSVPISSVSFPPLATSPKKPIKKVNPFHVNHVKLHTLDSVIKSFQQQDQQIPQSIHSTASSSPVSSSIFSYLVASSHKLNVILRKRQLKKDLAKFLHQSLFSPRPSTLKKAIKKGFLTSFPGLTENLVDKHLEPSVATESGHLRQEKQHLQSTSNHLSDTDFFPPREDKTKDVIFAITTYKDKDLAAADLTGRFPYRSSRGHQYVMVMYHWDTNVIWGHPFKKRTASDIVSAWTVLNSLFSSKGYKPNLFIFDNEFSGEFRTALKDEQITLQLVTPHMHRNNPAERAIQT